MGSGVCYKGNVILGDRIEPLRRDGDVITSPTVAINIFENSEPAMVWVSHAERVRSGHHLSLAVKSGVICQ